MERSRQRESKKRKWKREVEACETENGSEERLIEGKKEKKGKERSWKGKYGDNRRAVEKEEREGKMGI